MKEGKLCLFIVQRNSIWLGCGVFLVEIKQEINLSPSPLIKQGIFIYDAKNLIFVDLSAISR